MTLPFTLPAWLPWWVPLVLLVPALLYAMLLLAMPFNVFGVKGRLDVLEARLDEIQGEIRSLTLRLPEPLRGGADFDDTGYAQPMAERDRMRQRAASRPPIPPRSPSIGEPYLRRRQRTGACSRPGRATGWRTQPAQRAAAGLAALTSPVVANLSGRR